jgi:hypothetical protein
VSKRFDAYLREYEPPAAWQAVAADLLTLETNWHVVEMRASEVFRDCVQAAASR